MYCNTLVVFNFISRFFIPLYNVAISTVSNIYFVGRTGCGRGCTVIQAEKQIPPRYLFNSTLLPGIYLYFRLLWYMGTSRNQSFSLNIYFHRTACKVFGYCNAPGAAIPGFCLVNADTVFIWYIWKKE